LKKHEVSARAPAVLDRIGAIRHAGTPLPASLQSDGFLSLQAIHADVLKEMVSFDRVFGMRAQTRQQPPARPEGAV
jgi:hypothetical protein